MSWPTTARIYPELVHYLCWVQFVELSKLSQTLTKEPGGLFSCLYASLSSPSPPPGHHLQPASAGPGVGQHVRWLRAHGRKGPNPSIYIYYVYSPTQKSKRPAGCQSNHHRGDGNLAKRPAGIGNLASRSRRTQRRGVHRRTAARLVWGLGVSRRRTRHWPP